LSRAAGLWILWRSEGWTLFKHRHRLIIHLLSLALLIAQLGMQAHAYSHLTPEKHGTPAAQFCGECLSFAPLLGMAGASAAIALTHQSHDDYLAPADVTSVASRLPPAAFRSRAPPRVL